MNEADTCRKFVAPELQAAGWESDPHSIVEQRAERVKNKLAAFFSLIGPKARGLQNDLPEKYAADGELHYTLPDVLNVRPISDHGNANGIIRKFGGADQLRAAARKLQTPLCAE